MSPCRHIAEVLEQALQKVAGAGNVLGVQFKPCINVMSQKPGPDSPLVIGNIARVNISVVAALIILVVRCENYRDELQGKWKQLKGSIKEKLGKLTDDGVNVVEGKYDQLVGKIRQRYGVTRDEAEKQVRDWRT